MAKHVAKRGRPGPYSRAIVKGATAAWRNRKALWSVGKRAAGAVKKAWNVKRKAPSQASKSNKRRRTVAFESDDLHSAKAVSKHVIRLGKATKKKTEGHFIYHQQNAMLFSCGSGSQSIGSLGLDLTSYQIGVQGASANATSSDYYNNLFSMNPNIRATGDVIGQVAQGTVLNNTKLHVSKIKWDIQIVNGSSHATDVIVYAVIPKKGGKGTHWTGAGYSATSAGCLTDLNSIISRYPGISTATQANDAGGLQTNAGFGKTGQNIYGFSPFQIPAFGKEWKCVLKREINLAGGAIHKMEITGEIHKTFDQEFIYDQSTNGNYALPYKTIQFFAILRGSPVIVRENDGSLPTAENAPVTTSTGLVGFTVSKKIHGSFMTAAMSNKIDYALPSFRFVSGNTHLKEVNAVDADADVEFA